MEQELLKKKEEDGLRQRRPQSIERGGAGGGQYAEVSTRDEDIDNTRDSLLDRMDGGDSRSEKSILLQLIEADVRNQTIDVEIAENAKFLILTLVVFQLRTSLLMLSWRVFPKKINVCPHG